MKNLKTIFWVIPIVIFLVNTGWGQPWSYDFGTGTGTYSTSNSSSTSFFSSTPANGGTYRVRCGNGVQGSGFILANPGVSLGTGTELQINASSSTSTNKFGVYDWSSPSTVAYMKCKYRTTSSGNGNLNFSLGINTLANDNQGYTSHYNNSLSSFTIAYTSGAISSVVRRLSGGNQTVLGSGLSKDADQVIEIYANNGAASVNYTRNGTSYSLATKTWDLWVDGTRVINNAATAGTLASGTNLSGFGFFAESSTTNSAWIYIDDLEYSNSLPLTVTAPTTQASSINFSSVQSSQMTVNWTNGDGAKRVVIMNTSNSFTNPTDGTDPTANTVYGGSGEQVVYNNSSNTVTVTGLSPNTAYWYRVYEYNGSGTSTKYLTTTATNNPNSQTTPYATPSTQASSINFTDIQTDRMTVNWTRGNGSNVAVFMKQGSGTITNPSNGTSYSASSDWNSKGTELGSSGYYCVYNGSSTSVTVMNLAQGTTYYVQAFEYNGTGTGTVYNTNTATNNPNSGTTSSSSPTLNVNPSTLTGFSTSNGTASSSQFYVLSGSNLQPPDENISVTPPTGFEVSTDNTNFYSSIVISYTGGTITSQNIYVRIASSATAGNVSGNVVNSGGSVSPDVNVSVSGFVYSSQPTNQPSNIQFSSVTSTSFTVSWTAGNGANTIVLIKSGSAVNSDPVDGASYTANTAFGVGSQIGTGNYVVYNSTGTSVSITGLSASTTYYVALYSFNGNGGTENYLTTSPATGNQATSAPPVMTYTWTGAVDGLWTTAGNWSPSRTTPATSDIIQFNSGTTITVTAVPTQTISQLSVTNNTTVNLQSGVVTLSIAGGIGADLSVSAGSQLNFNGSSALSMALGAGATGSISGNMTFSGAAHRLTGTDASSITFNNGSLFTAASGFTGNAYGATSFNSIIFASGSTYVCQAGSNPFGASAPNSVVTFQAGSLFRMEVNSAPSLSGRTYANFEINFATFSQTMTGSAILTMDNLTVTSGTANINLFTSGVVIKGNISVASGATLNFTPATAGNYTLSGTTTQNIGGSGTLTFGTNSTLIINNANGVTLSKDLVLNGNLTLTLGKFSIGNSNLSIPANSTITTPSSSSYIVTDGTGKFTITQLATSEKIFPIGTSSSYNPVWIYKPDAAPVDFAVKVTSTFSTAPPDPTKVVPREWEIVPSTNTGSSYRLKFQLNSSDYSNSFNPNGTIVLGHYSGSAWTEIAATMADQGSGIYLLTANGITSFSPFAIGNEGALPVTLASFNSNVVTREVKLNWVTTSENNNVGFEIERAVVSSQQLEFSKVAFVSGNGTTNSSTSYNFTDSKLNTGKYKYRLKQIDNNGNFEYFDLDGVVEIGVPTKYSLSQNYPNPFNPVTKIDFDIPVDSKVSIKVFDVTGREVKTLVNEFRTAGYYTVQFDGSTLSSGVYFYRIQTGDNKFVMTKKLLLLK